jgi:pimeloyl-ACP methyl ester carboxylesterase
MRVNGYDIAYAERGAGTPVVMVHGSLTDYRFFGNQMRALSAGHRAVALSLRHFYPEVWDGTGGSFSMQQHVSDVAEFIAALEGGPVHLVGHSRGASLCLYLAMRHPERVRSLVVAEGGGNMPAFEGESGPIAEGLKPREVNARAVAQFEAGRLDAGLAQWLDTVSGPGAWNRISEAARQTLRDNAWTLKGQAGDLFPPFGRDDAGRIRAPVLLVGGANSPAYFGRMLDAIGRCIPQAQRVTIPATAHNIPVGNPVAFNRAVLDFISRH